MDTNKNLYTVIYSIIMVVVVAVVLALAAYLLKDRQQRNIEIETKDMILRSAGLASQAESAADYASYIEGEYDKYITDTTVTSGGESLPLHISRKDGESFYILPLRGTGLWGPIWGYITLMNDFNTVHGIVFDHKGETPGLGAEIKTSEFSDQFKGKKLFEGTNFVSVLVVKGGTGAIDPHKVDAISGGTITSKGVEDMLKSSISKYLEYFNSNKINPAEVSDSTFINLPDTTGQNK
ncbi:MAG: NADH:ubiquinone reductase (Na(+)-transporting) subunit C [Bacteroidales bacterium]|nr:NADH:ubiquinone reductase (Na(+)-transporting) subunit C [Bacteroidales bacterium]MDD2425715.1 NADH:ubiquinone reductase (Na(+)-transporting) subunit C [Bacteroidales bacterium]MDD3989796.1 NADH:ubiquinone reductase (Na(+)-transporting) subunit C [Bacteroidales bacterium]